MKLIIVIAILCVCGVILILGITGFFYSPPPSKANQDTLAQSGPTHFKVFHETIENYLLYTCRIQASKIAKAPKDVKRRWNLTKPEIVPKDKTGRNDAVITADRAVLDQKQEKVRGKLRSNFLTLLCGNVRIEGNPDNNLLMTGEELLLDQNHKTVSSNKPVRLSDMDYNRMLITGSAMEGGINFGQVVFKRDVCAFFAGNLFSRPEDTGGDKRISRITCKDKMVLRQFNDSAVINGFLAAFDGLCKSLVGIKPEEQEQAALRCLRYFQGHFREQYIQPSNTELGTKAITEHFGEILPGQDPTGNQIKLMLKALQYLRELSGQISAEEVGMLRKISAMLKSGELNMSLTSKKDVSLVVITFSKDVVAITRSLPGGENLEEVEILSARGLLSEPYIDSWQKCDKLMLFLKQYESQSDSDASASRVMEPMKIEMIGEDRPVVMKAYSPVEQDASASDAGNAVEMRMDSLRQCRRVNIYLEPDPDKEGSPPRQRRIEMLGEVLLQSLRAGGGKDDSSQKLYETCGDKLIWDKKLGYAELTGAEGNPPHISYSNMHIASEDRGTKAPSCVFGRCADRITLHDIDKYRSRVTLHKDVILEMSRAGALPGEPLETLSALDWVEMIFDKRTKTHKTSDSIFGGIEGLDAAGEVRTTGRKGQTSSDLLIYRMGEFENRPSKVLNLYRINGCNREELLRGRTLTKNREWPLESVMNTASSQGLLDSGRADNDKKTKTPATYTINCNEKITYAEFADDITPPRIATVVVFDKNVNLLKQEDGSRDTTRLTADERLTLRFIGKEDGRNSEGRRFRSLNMVSLRAEGGSTVTESKTERDAARIQIAQGDEIFWRRMAGGQASAILDETLISGKGRTTPELRYTVDKPKKQKTGAEQPAEKAIVTEETTLSCSHNGGVITITRRCADGSPEKLIAHKDAHIRQKRRITVNKPDGKKPWENLLQMQADLCIIYMIPDPDERGGSSILLKKIEAFNNVLIGGDAFTAVAQKAIWERFYKDDIKEETRLADTEEETRLIATESGNPNVDIRRLDSNGNPGVTHLTCSGEILLKKVIWDADVNPKYSSQTQATLKKNAQVLHEGFADKRKKAGRENTYISCDTLDIFFLKNPRTAKSSPDNPEEETYRIERIKADGNARYAVYGTRMPTDPFPEKAVLIRDGEGGEIEYRTPGTRNFLGTMRGTMDEERNFIKPARRTEYLSTGAVTESKNVLAPVYDEK